MGTPLVHPKCTLPWCDKWGEASMWYTHIIPFRIFRWVIQYCWPIPSFCQGRRPVTCWRFLMLLICSRERCHSKSYAPCVLLLSFSCWHFVFFLSFLVQKWVRISHHIKGYKLPGLACGLWSLAGVSGLFGHISVSWSLGLDTLGLTFLAHHVHRETWMGMFCNVF